MIEHKEAGFLAKVLLLTSKDLRIEVRGRDTLPPMLAFAITVALLLAFALPDPSIRVDAGAAGALTADIVAAFFWITVLFAGLIGFGRAFELERADGAIDTLFLVPLDRAGLFLSKALANLTFVVVVEALLLPAFALLFEVSVWSDLLVLLVVIALVDVGFVAAGTLFASLAAQTRSRELMLPILALPVLVPVFIAAFELTSDLLAGRGFEEVAARGWFGILIAFDVVFATVAMLTFEYVVDA